MVINSIFGILHQSGVPFLDKQFGDKTLPFTLIASLGGLFTFTKGQENAELLEFSYGSSLKIRYKLYNGVILLIHVSDDIYITQLYVQSVMDHLHLIMISEFGMKNLINCPNADKLKSSVLPTLNVLTTQLLNEFNHSFLHHDTYRVALFNRETKHWSHKLEKYLDLVDTTYGCVFFGHTVHMLSTAWSKLPFKECINLLISCSRVTLPPEKVLHKKTIYLPISSPNSPFLLVCTNYHPFRIFSLCPVTLEDSDILSAFHRVFTAKDRNVLVKEENGDSLKFDSAILALSAVRNSESIVYVSEMFSDTTVAHKVLTYATSRELVTGDTFDDNGNMGSVNSFFTMNKNMNCHVLGNGVTLVAALLKPNVSQILSEALILDIVKYFDSDNKK